jgi:hypothetical protein
MLYLLDPYGRRVCTLRHQLLFLHVYLRVGRNYFRFIENGENGDRFIFSSENKSVPFFVLPFFVRFLS